MKKIVLSVLIMGLGASFMGCSAAKQDTPLTTKLEEMMSVEEIIWAKELAIFEGRGQGELNTYINSSSDHYLGWPPVLKAPANLDTLKASADRAMALNGEVSILTRKGFTHNGDTAIMYFLNNRQRLGDGFAPEGERDVNEFYENVHIWNKEDGDWKLIGGFARTVDGDRD